MPIIYYYCDYADVRTLHTEHIFEAILKQLLIKALVPEDVECQLKQSFVDEVRTAGTKQLQENICSAIAACSRICIIVDGLDECEKAATREVIALLEYLLTLDITIIKVLVSCREDDQILTSLDAYPRIQLSESMLATDIEAFIMGSVRSKIHDRELRVNDPTLEHEIVSELVTKAHGMSVPHALILFRLP